MIKKEWSVFFDLTRFLAAILVLLHHAEQIFKEKNLSYFASFGHDAVIFFFILSGFVIRYTAEFKNYNFSDYLLARTARIYSVAIPSLLLVYILITIGSSFSLNYDSYQNLDWLYILGVNTFFLNGTSLFTVPVPTNGPYWSIAYEVWYYLIFGVFFYFRGIKKWCLLCVLFIVAGIKVLALFPLWLLGVWFYNNYQNINVNKIASYFLLLLALILYCLNRALNFDDYLVNLTYSFLGGGENSNQLLGFSKRFLADYVIGLLMLLMLVSLIAILPLCREVLTRYSEGIKKMSSYTFSLYLYHFPILLFINNYIESAFVAILISFLVIFLLARVTEHKMSQMKELIRYIVTIFQIKRV